MFHDTILLLWLMYSAVKHPHVPLTDNESLLSGIQRSSLCVQFNTRLANGYGYSGPAAVVRVEVIALRRLD